MTTMEWRTNMSDMSVRYDEWRGGMSTHARGFLKGGKYSIIIQHIWICHMLESLILFSYAVAHKFLKNVSVNLIKLIFMKLYSGFSA